MCQDKDEASRFGSYCLRWFLSSVICGLGMEWNALIHEWGNARQHCQVLIDEKWYAHAAWNVGFVIMKNKRS